MGIENSSNARRIGQDQSFGDTVVNDLALKRAVELTKPADAFDKYFLGGEAQILDQKRKLLAFLSGPFDLSLPGNEKVREELIELKNTLTEYVAVREAIMVNESHGFQERSLPQNMEDGDSWKLKLPENEQPRETISQPVSKMLPGKDPAEMERLMSERFEKENKIESLLKGIHEKDPSLADTLERIAASQNTTN